MPKSNPNLLTLPRKARIRSKRAAIVAHWFGIEPLNKPKTPNTQKTIEPPIPSRRHRNKLLRSLLPAPGEILLITGPSGAGKSSTLVAMRKLASRQINWIDLQHNTLPNRPIVDCLESHSTRDDESLPRILSALGRVGLAEVWTYLRTPGELSEGQRWRLKLALAMEQATSQKAAARSIIIADEFAALLDRVTACVISRALRRAIDSAPSPRPAAIVATSHDDLIDALQPDRVLACDFEEAVIRARDEPPPLHHRRSAKGDTLPRKE